MLDFDFDVVTGPSKASCPIPLDEPPAEAAEEPAAPPTAPARSAGN